MNKIGKPTTVLIVLLTGTILQLPVKERDVGGHAYIPRTEIQLNESHR